MNKIIRFKDYSGFSMRENQYAEAIDQSDSGVKFKWLIDGVEAISQEANVVIMKSKSISAVASKLKEGDIVITNADGSKSMSRCIIGKVGEIKKDGSNYLIYIWNDFVEGSVGDKAIEHPYKYSWMIKSKNRTGQIIICRTPNKRGTACANCGTKFKQDDMKEGADGELYCEDCFSELFVICANCEEVINKDDAREGSDEEYYCEECWCDLFAICDRCDKTISVDDSHFTDDGCYCDHCFNELYAICHSCGETISSDDALTGADDNVYCDNCFSERFASCSRCGDTHHLEDLVERDNEMLCSDCRDDSGTKCIHDYSHRPTAQFQKMKWEQPLYFGIELEVRRKEDASEAQKLMDFLYSEGTSEHFYLKSDSSIHDGFEIVTHPFTMQYAHKHLKFGKTLKWLEDNNFASDATGNCGLHVHIDKKFFEDLDITKLRLFFRTNKERLIKFSRRTEHGLNYCRFEESSLKDITQQKELEGRYWAVNLNSSRETVEIRLFKGTLDIHEFTATMQFVQALCYFVKDVGITSLILGEKEYYKNSWRLFIDWCKDEGHYGEFLQYIEKEKLCV